MNRIRDVLAFGALASVLATLIAAGVSSASVGSLDSGGSRGAVVFVSERSVGEDDIVITSRAINADGSGLRRLRWNAESDSWAWSPDGTKIAYRVGHSVYVINANGTHPRRIARGAGWGFTWSPDGRRLAYVDPSAGIYVVDIARATKRKVALGRDVAWSPRADRLAFVQGETLVVTRADGTDQRVITSGVWAMPRWSPDGTRIAFPKEEGGLSEAALLYVAEADGTNARPLTPKTEVFKYSSDFDWSPRSDRIVVRVGRKALVLRTDGGGAKIVADGLFDHTDAGPPTWFLDGKRIAFVRGSWRPVARSDIWVMNADGSQKKRLTRNHAARGLDLQPRWDPRGRKAGQLFPRSSRSKPA
jgi:Tol biopolymer transport system component